MEHNKTTQTNIGPVRYDNFSQLRKRKGLFYSHTYQGGSCYCRSQLSHFLNVKLFFAGTSGPPIHKAVWYMLRSINLIMFWYTIFNL